MHSGRLPGSLARFVDVIDTCGNSRAGSQKNNNVGITRNKWLCVFFSRRVLERCLHASHRNHMHFINKSIRLRRLQYAQTSTCDAVYFFSFFASLHYYFLEIIGCHFLRCAPAGICKCTIWIPWDSSGLPCNWKTARQTLEPYAHVNYSLNVDARTLNPA